MAEVAILPASAIALPVSHRQSSASAHVDRQGPLPQVQVTMQGKTPIVTNAQQLAQQLAQELSQPDVPMASGAEVGSVLPIVHVTMQGKVPMVSGGGNPAIRSQPIARVISAPPRPQLGDGDLFLCKTLVEKYLAEEKSKEEADAEAKQRAELAAATLLAIEAALAPPPVPTQTALAATRQMPTRMQGAAPPPVIVTMHGRTPIVQQPNEGPRPIAVSSARGSSEHSPRVAPPPRRPQQPQGASPFGIPPQSQPQGASPFGIPPQSQAASFARPAVPQQLPPPVLPDDMPDDLRAAIEKEIPALKAPPVTE